MVAELGGAEGEARVGRVGVGGGGRGWEGGLELWVVVGVDGWRGQEPMRGVRVRVGEGLVCAQAQGHLMVVDYGASLLVGQTVAMLEEGRGGRARG